MTFGSQITNPIQRQLPKAHGLVSASIVGIGSYSVARWVDGLLGNKIQSIGIALPIIGSLSLLDAVLLLTFKTSMHKNSQVAAAFIGDRVFNLRFGVPGLSSTFAALPSLKMNPTSPTASSGPQGGGF